MNTPLETAANLVDQGNLIRGQFHGNELTGCTLTLLRHGHTLHAIYNDEMWVERVVAPGDTWQCDGYHDDLKRIVATIAEQHPEWWHPRHGYFKPTPHEWSVDDLEEVVMTFTDAVYDGTPKHTDNEIRAILEKAAALRDEQL